MPKFRKKPVEIEAFQLPPFGEDPSPEMVDWLHQFDANWIGEGGHIVIHTLEGYMTANPGDWIIKGVKGEMYPCKSDIFAETYERVG